MKQLARNYSLRQLLYGLVLEDSWYPLDLSFLSLSSSPMEESLAEKLLERRSRAGELRGSHCTLQLTEQH